MIPSLLLASCIPAVQPGTGEASGTDPNSHITKIWCLQVKSKKDKDF